MTHVACRLTAKNRDQLRNLHSVIEYGLPLPFLCDVCLLDQPYLVGMIEFCQRSRTLFSRTREQVLGTTISLLYELINLRHSYLRFLVIFILIIPVLFYSN